MDKKKILFISDFNLRGSGYLNISVPLCMGLSSAGFDVKAIGLGYVGDEQNFNFSLIPCRAMMDSYAMLNNLYYQWKMDVVIIAMDIPRQEEYVKLCKQLGVKSIAITPLENPPLTMSWAFILEQLDKTFFISQLGEDEAKKAGLDNAEHLVVGMDTKAWRMRTKDEYQASRKMLNISDDTTVVLTVADNQERKHLSKAMEIVSSVKKKGRKVKYILVTREHSEVGWKLRDLAMTYGIASDLLIFERGLPFKELFALYAMADVFLLTSKAEGLCMPVMEAMSVGVPVVATKCGALPELLGDGRGFLMETEYSHIDPWGNSRRDFPLASSGVDGIFDTVSNPELPSVKLAREYMEQRTWDKPIKQVIDAMEKLLNEKQ